jgi:5'-3' exonuclease
MKSILELDQVVNSVPLENLLIIDCMNFAFRFKQRGSTDFAVDFLKTIDSFASSYGAREVILTADLKYSKYRKNIDPGYKEGRKAKYVTQTEEEKEQVKLFFEGYEKALELAAAKYSLIRLEYVEADDLAAYLVRELSSSFEHTWLISSDADWDLLLADNVSRFSFITRKEYINECFYDDHSCDSAEQFLSIKVLQGDTGDSIPGVEGVGIKRAYNLVREYGSAFDIHDQIPLEGSQKFIQNINASADLILKNYKLIDLVSFCEDAIAFPCLKNIKTMETFCAKYRS